MKYLALLLLLPSIVFGAGTATLAWDYSAADITASGVTAFNIERKSAACGTAGAFAEVAQVAPTARTFTDPNLVSGTTYCWRVAATGQGGKSPYSNTVDKLIPFTVPPAPGNLTTTITITLNPDTGKWEMLVVN